MEPIILQLHFGAMSPTIARQLKDQKFKYNTEEVKHFEKLKESITYLWFSSLINDSCKEKAVKKLFTKVKQHVIKQNKKSKK